MAAQANQILNGTAAPTDVTQFYQLGDMVINVAPVSGQPFGWKCVVAGYPGTWLPIVLESQQSLTYTATTGTLANGYRVILLNAASGPTLSLPNAASHAATWELTIKNIANNSATITAVAANNYIDAAAITLAQNAVVTLISNGGTTWYKKA
jgi:hypothetical protein